jgi:DNA-directed RNA polymerase subunit alpha
VLIAQRPELKEEVLSPTRSRFVLEPLEPGFGYTLGNSLRRTLLSSIPGAAVTNVRFEGVSHEFSTIDGVKEDVTEIILNIKDLVVSVNPNREDAVVARIAVSKPGTITAADIEVDGDVEIHNKDLVIATLTKGKFEMQMNIERGRGYIQASQNKIANADVGVIPIDSIYSPVLKVSYRVEATRAGEYTNFDKLIVDVETKPSIKPADAVASAGSTLVALFGLAKGLNEQAEGIELGEARSELAVSPELAMPIEDLDLTVRSYNCLKREGINNVGELINLSEDQLMNIRNFGSKSVDEVRDKLTSMGLKFRDSVPGFDGTYFSNAANYDDEDELA